MTDRWAQAEENFRRQEANRRYRRDEAAWARSTNRRSSAPVAGDPERGGWDPYGDEETTVLPVYADDATDEYADEEVHEPTTRPARTRSRSRPDPRPRSDRPRSGGQRTTGQRNRQRTTGQRKKRSRIASRKAAERKKRRRTMFAAGGALALVLVLAVGYVVMKLANSYTAAEDFAGPPGPMVVVRVHEGDTAQQVAETMYDKGVVASSAAFYEAAVQDSEMGSLRPGYYAVPSQSPAEDAVSALVAEDSRVGALVVSEGRQLHDQHDVNTGSRKEGIYTKIAEASCLGEGADQDCLTYEELEAAGANTDLAALGVPEWARESVQQVPDRARQLEGLIAAGTWNFDPTGTPEQILRQLVADSARSYESTGLLESNSTNGLSPYETLIAASLIEREALPQDMSKVARVIVNRLDVGQPLQFDSSVNYSLDTTEVATTDVARAEATPWNTYANAGLPATPISSPSLEALNAMEEPEPGNWLFFVTIDKEGNTLFTDSYSEHLSNIDRAMESGILDSGR